MRKFKFDSLSNIKLEMEPLTESPEGLLLGGFVGLAGTYDAPVPNNGCNNNGCTTDRINNGCTNSGCINNGCTNNGCVDDKDAHNNGCTLNGTGTVSGRSLINFTGLLV